MANIKKNVSLQAYNSFGIYALATHFVEITSISDLKEVSKSHEWNLPKFILGGGSNILLIDDFKGLVIYMNNKGIEIVNDSKNSVQIKVQAGENWHQFVLFALENGLGGIENLSLIPGRVGASPMQNIGAYGVEIEQVFVELTAFHIKKKEFHTFKKDDCEFGYRSSIFKTSEKGNYIITDVTYQLSKKPKVNTNYGAIQSVLNEKNIQHPTIKDVSDAVIEIRQSKLPDPDKIGNSGSFFKNPIVENKFFETIKAANPNMPYYNVGDNAIKIPAGWLIEQCGFKGIIHGNTGTYKNQALIIVNTGNATGEEIWNFAQCIQQKVEQKFGIFLEPEVNLIGESKTTDL